MNIFDKITHILGEAGKHASVEGWAPISRCQTYASIIMALRPSISIEVGVWHGRGALAMGLAHMEIGSGNVYAVDPWQAEESVRGQEHPSDIKHWSNQGDHDRAHSMFSHRVNSLAMSQCVQVVRKRSRDFEPPDNVGFFVLDGNHGPEAIDDVAKYFPKVRRGGIVYMDDIGWTGGNVLKAMEKAKSMGFVELYPMDNGMFLQRL